jgi:hypothetical protein
MDDLMKEALKELVGPDISNCMFAIQAIAGYELSNADQQPFLYFYDYLTNGALTNALKNGITDLPTVS